MLQYLFDMRVHFQQIRTMALAINQPLIAYLAEMGIAECNDQMVRLRSKPDR